MAIAADARPVSVLRLRLGCGESLRGRLPLPCPWPSRAPALPRTPADLQVGPAGRGGAR